MFWLRGFNSDASISLQRVKLAGGRGVLGCPWPPNVSLFFKQTTHNIQVRKLVSALCLTQGALRGPPPTLKNPGYPLVCPQESTRRPWATKVGRRSARGLGLIMSARPQASSKIFPQAEKHASCGANNVNVLAGLGFGSHFRFELNWSSPIQCATL